MNPMNPNAPSQGASDAVEAPILALYQRMHDAWNARDADAFAACFDADGISIGFDGSAAEPRTTIREHLAAIFAHHPTGRYVAKVREVRFLGDQVALLRAVAGVVPAAQDALAPQLNALQTLVARREADTWRIVLLQNTPAQFHGQPELAERLTEELQALVR